MMYPKNSWGLLPNCMDIQYPPKVLEACMYVGFSTKQNTQCLKAIEKVAFNIASEASYVYIFVDKRSLKILKCCICGQTVLPDRTKIGEKCRNSKIQLRHFVDFLKHWGNVLLRFGTWTYFVTVGHVDDGSYERRLKKQSLEPTQILPEIPFPSPLPTTRDGREITFKK